MKYALITGGTKGIGRAVSEKLLEDGYYVILNYAYDDDNANDLYQKLSVNYHGKISLVKMNLTNFDNIEAFYNQIIAITSVLDVLVLNTGVTHRGSLEETTRENWQHVMDTNLTIPFFILQKLVPNLKKGSSIVFTGSLMGIFPHSVSISYGVSKAAVHALVKNLVKYLSVYDIRVNAVAPGFTDTAWQQTKPSQVRNNIISNIATGRFANPAEIADACIFLVRNLYMNGEILVIDGGYNFK